MYNVHDCTLDTDRIRTDNGMSCPAAPWCSARHLPATVGVHTCTIMYRGSGDLPAVFMRDSVCNHVNLQ